MNHQVFTPQVAVQHLQPEIWSKVNSLLVCKAISEFAHELLIRPHLTFELGVWGHYVLNTDHPQIEYRFRAQVLNLDHWFIDKSSLEKWADHRLASPDALSFIIEMQKSLGITKKLLPEYLEEVSSTLYSSAYKHARKGLSAVELTEAGFQEVEAAMMEGHPIFVANNGRMGFDAADYFQYAPEVALPVALVWLAGHRSQASFHCIQELSYEALLEIELGTSSRALFSRKLQEEGVTPEDYFFIPVHPWQWNNKIAQIFAADIANRQLIFMGHSEDSYQAQQSIRTFYNTSHPKRHYVKTALNILNMGFTRGLSPARMVTTPAINEWVSELIKEDPYLTKNGFSILREVAAVGYRHRYHEQVVEEPSSSFKEMLSALWRESPMNQLKPGQRLMTMASLLHLDRKGNSLLVELIQSSGLDTETWLQKYLDCYLKPQLHCLYAHHLIFTPHGENVILVLKDNVPVRAIMKDIAEDIGVVNPEIELPKNVRGLAIPVPEELMTLSVFTDVFDCIFRFLAHILYEHSQFPEDHFWQLVADCILDYQQEQPQFRQKFERYDLFAPDFIRNCLNRLQLINPSEMVDLNSADPVQSLQFAGTLINPIAKFNPSLTLDASTRKFQLDISGHSGY